MKYNTVARRISRTTAAGITTNLSNNSFLSFFFGGIAIQTYGKNLGVGNIPDTLTDIDILLQKRNSIVAVLGADNDGRALKVGDDALGGGELGGQSTSKIEAVRRQHVGQMGRTDLESCFNLVNEVKKKKNFLVVVSSMITSRSGSWGVLTVLGKSGTIQR